MNAENDRVPGPLERGFQMCRFMALHLQPYRRKLIFVRHFSSFQIFVRSYLEVRARKGNPPILIVVFLLHDGLKIQRRFS